MGGHRARSVGAGGSIASAASLSKRPQLNQSFRQSIAKGDIGYSLSQRVNQLSQD
jgi:hypothetical protein